MGSVTTFVSYSSQQTVIVMKWLVQSSVISSHSIFSFILPEVLCIAVPSVTYGMPLKVLIDIRHFATRVRLTHVLQDNLCFHSVISLWAGPVLIRPHDFQLSLRVLLTAAHEKFLWIKKRNSFQFPMEDNFNLALVLRTIQRKFSNWLETKPNQSDKT